MMKNVRIDNKIDFNKLAVSYGNTLFIISNKIYVKQ